MNEAVSGGCHRRRRRLHRPLADPTSGSVISWVVGPTSGPVDGSDKRLDPKLNARNRVEIAMWAHETGRIDR